MIDDAIAEPASLIYALAHPETGEIRYVGSTTKKLSERLKSHLHETRGAVSAVGMNARQQWIASLLAASTKPAILLLEDSSGKRRFDVERLWINKMLNEGKRLLNAGLTVPPVFATPSDYVEAIRGLREVAAGDMRHTMSDQCPDGSANRYGSRDPNCGACKSLMRSDRLLGVSP